MSLSLDRAKRLTKDSLYYQSGNLLVLLDNDGRVTWFGPRTPYQRPEAEEKHQAWMAKGWLEGSVVALSGFKSMHLKD